MHVASESLAWFDPALLTADHHFDNDGDDENHAVKRLVSAAVRRRLELDTLTSCALNSGSVHALFRAAERTESIGARVDVPACPIDAAAEPFAHIAVAGGTYAIVPATRPPSLCIFDQINAMPVSRVPLTHDSRGTPGRNAEKSVSGDGNDENNDSVAAIFLNPCGRFCIVRWDSGRAEYIYIPRRSHCASADVPAGDANPTGDFTDSETESELSPRRFPLRLRSELTGLREPFVIASVAWDTANTRDTSTGEILLGSSRGGFIVSCRLEHSGVVAGVRCVFQFPPPLRVFPVDSIAHAVVFADAAPCLRRRVAIVAQRNRLFVFAGPWATATATAFGCAALSCASAFAAARRAGEAPSAIALPVGAAHGARSEVALLGPGELCPSQGRERPAGTGVSARYGPPTVFAWRYGATLTHGVVLAHAREKEEEEGEKEEKERQRRRRMLPVQQQRGGGGDRSETGPAVSAVLPVWVMSVARLDDALREFTALCRRDRAGRPFMFRLAQTEDMAEPAEEEKEKEGGGGGEEETKEKHQCEVWDAETIGTLAQLHYKLRRGAFDVSVCGDPFQRNVRDDIYVIKSEDGTRERDQGRNHTNNVDKDNNNNNNEEEEETLVSFAMGYGHFLITTTCAVYAFCHFAALPFPQRGAQWKQSLVFAQRLPAPSKDNTHSRSSTNNHINSRGNKSDGKGIVYIEHGSETKGGWAVGIHNTGRSQCFHVFAKSFLYDLYLGSRRRGQYITQLLDALSPVQSIAVVGHGDDAFLSPSRHAAFFTNATTADNDHHYHYHYPEDGRGRKKGDDEKEAEKRIRKRSIPFHRGEAMGAVPSAFPEPSPPRSDARADPISLERFVSSYGPRIVPLLGVGILGGLAAPGTCDMRLCTSDALCGMALHVAAATQQSRKRHMRLAAVRRTYAARLFSSQRYLESAAQYGLMPPDAPGPPFLNALIVDFAAVARRDIEPLLLLLLLRLRGYERHARGFGGNSVEVSCLATCLVPLLLERDNQLRKGCAEERERRKHEEEYEREIYDSADPYVDIPAFLRRKYELRNPKRLLDSVLSRCQSFIEWTAIRTAVFGMTDPAQTVALCSSQGRHGEVLSYLLCERNRPLEGMICLERMMSQRSQSDGAVGGSNDSRRVVGSALRSYMLYYASLFMRRCPCRFVRHGLIALADSSGSAHGSSSNPHHHHHHRTMYTSIGGQSASAAGCVVDSVRLIPALLLYDPRRNETALEADGDAELVLQREVIEESLMAAERARAPYHAARLYLEHTLQMEGYAENSLASLLLFFIARDCDDATLSQFFREHYTSGDASGHTSNNNSSGVDLTYAYRLCWRLQRPIGCAWAYFAMGRYAEAVRLAMGLRDEGLVMEFIRGVRATAAAAAGEDAGTVRRALWKELAVATASNRQGGSRRALQLIAESEGDLNVSDILPHLFVDVMIMEFREELLAGVASFGNTLAELRQTIDASMQDAEVLRHDAAAVRRRPLFLSAEQRCTGCGNAALTRPFVAFQGCRHVLHKTCFDARRASMEAELRRLQGGEASEADEANLECVVCSRRYLRLMLEVPLTRGIQGDIPRLP